MDFTIIIGLAIAFGILVKVIGIQASAHLFLSSEALIVVIGGLIAASFVQFPLSQLKELGPRVRVLFFSRKRNYRNDILMLLKMSKKLHQSGHMSFEQDIEAIKDPFMKHALQMVMEKVEPEKIRRMLNEMIDHSEKRHEQGIYYFEQLAKLAPGFALVGTLVGMIKMLSSLQDPQSIGPHMATALVSTFYGVTLSNLIFLPLAGRFRVFSYEERLHKEILIEGIVGMASGDLPYNIFQKINMIVTQKDRAFLSKEK